MVGLNIASVTRQSLGVAPITYRAAAATHMTAAAAVTAYEALTTDAARKAFKAVTIQDSAENIKAKFSNLKAMGVAGKLSAVKATGVTPTLTLAAADLANSSALLAKLSGASLQVSDTSANLATHFASLLTANSKLSTITQTDAQGALSITTAQMTSGAALLAKVNGGTYALALSDVNAKTLVAARANTKVTSFSFVDTSANIGLQLAALNAAGDRVTEIRQLGTATPITITDTLFSASSHTIDKISGSFSLSLTGVTTANLANRLGDDAVASVSITDTSTNVSANFSALAAAGTRLKGVVLTNTSPSLSLTVAQLGSNVLSKISSKYTMKVADSSTNISAGMDTLLAKVKSLSAIEVTDNARATLKVTAAQYATQAAVLAKISGAALTVKMTGNYAAKNIVINKDGSFAVTNAGTKYTMKGVNFFEFNDFTAFGDTGDANVNALLSGTTNQWWFNTTTSTAKTSDTLIKPGLYALDSSSTKREFTYGFMRTLPAGATAGDRNGFEPMTQVQKAAVQDAFTYLSSLINVTFTESDSEDGNADINFGTNQQLSSAGYANPPNASGAHNVFLMLDKDEPSNASFGRGSYGWETLIHEIGHTLGLKHPGNYNAGGGGASAPYLPTATDTRRYSVMSYNQPADSMHVTVTGNGASAAYLNPSTFMSYDLAALQFLYGKATTSDLSNYQTLNFDANWKGFQSVYTPDGGTLNLSQVSKSNIVDLRQGAFSSINTLATDAKTYLSTITPGLQSYVKKNQTYYGYNNMSVSYGSFFDGVIGGTATDAIFIDTTSIKGNSQSIDGGEGTDIVYLTGSSTEWTVASWDGTADKEGTATHSNGKVVNLSNIEKIKYYNASIYSTLHSAIDLQA